MRWTIILALLVGLRSYSFSATPGGRLTIDASNCVMSSDQLGKQILYYAPCNGTTVPVVRSNGIVEWRTFTSGPTDSVGQSLNLAGSTNWAANSVHDVYEAYNGGTPVLCTAAWTNSYTTYVPDRIYEGFAVNSVAIATCRTSATATINCPMNQCTYLGSILIDSTAGQISAHFSYGQNRRFGVWNRYNQRNIMLKAGNPTYIWNSELSNIWNPVLHDAGNSLTVFTGRPTSFIAEYTQNAWLQTYNAPAHTAQLFTGVGWNSTSLPSGSWGQWNLEGYIGPGSWVRASEQLAAHVGIAVGKNVATALYRTQSVDGNPAYSGGSCVYVASQEEGMLLTAIWKG